MAQKLSPLAAKKKAERDLAYAKTPDRRAKKAENQRERRAAKKAGKNVEGKDFDHTKRKFVSVKENRGEYGNGTRTNTKKEVVKKKK
jgi:hypothetical protein